MGGLPFVHLLLFYFFFFFFIPLLFPQTRATLLKEPHICLDDQKSTLLQLQQESFINSTTWEPETDCCSWEGITCNFTTGYVIALDLSGSLEYLFTEYDFYQINHKLSRPIYSNSSLFCLHHLQRLNLAFNDFKLAPFPSGFDRLPSLTHLNLSHSNFSGMTPWAFSGLTRLVSLDLSTFNFDYYFYCYFYNFCNRVIKQERLNLKALAQNLTSLMVLYLNGVDLSSPKQGSNHWSQVLPQSLPNLRVLSLCGCRLSGPIHSSFSQLVLLKELRLDGNNNLSIEASKFLTLNFSHLETLSLSYCGLYGEFPSSVFQLPNLMFLDVSYNFLLSGQLPDFPLNNSFQFIYLLTTNFSGVIPDSIRNLRFLKILQLSNCSFFGSIPPSLTNLTQLIELDLSSNSFTGSIPMFNKDNVPNLTSLTLINNLLDGTIPSSLFTLPSLQNLWLFNNQLSGQLELFHNSSLSSSLEDIDLYANKLNGEIPNSISQFPFLQIIDLNSNNFSGTVKLEDIFGNLENIFSIDLSNNLLSIEFGNSSSFFRPQLSYLSLGSCHIKEFPSFLRTQEKLGFLNLSNNQIQGKVPNWLWKEQLQGLDLSYNSLNALEGPLLNFSSSSLESLNLRGNKIKGSLPIPASSITFFSISNNSFVGEIPKSICKLSGLQVFDASHNNLNGSIPECLGNIGTLSVLDVQGNKFHGMPRHFTDASSLRTLKMNGNILEGKVPRSLVNCTSLEVLDLGKNEMFDIFPFWLGKLPNLRVLVLHSNRFYGPIKHPQTLNEFPMLQILDLSSNKFTGSFPIGYFQSLKAMMFKKVNNTEPQYLGNFYYRDSVTIMNKGLEMELVRILTIYTALDLSNNSFQGEIPIVIGELTSLVVLNLSHNDLIGQIPSSIGNMAQLESLDLSQNKLSGQIPWQLTSLTFLEFLNLSQNHLEGPIPQGNQFDTFVNTSYNENPRLCGFPLSKRCKDTGDDMPPQSSQGEKSTDDFKDDWKLMLMGSGCGMVIGFVIGYIIFTDEWLVRFFRLAPIRRPRKSKGGRSRR